MNPSIDYWTCPRMVEHYFRGMAKYAKRNWLLKQENNQMTIKIHNPIIFQQINDLLESILASDSETLRSLIADCKNFSDCNNFSDLGYPFASPQGRKQHLRKKAALWGKFGMFLSYCVVMGLYKQEKKDGN